MRILLAEDDTDLAAYVRQALVEHGHAVDLANDGDGAWLMARSAVYDLLILDIMLPKRSGLDVLRQVRDSGSGVPVMLLTARDAVTDKVAGLDLGADDYMTKPFAVAELLARVRSLGRRKGAIDQPTLACADLTIQTSTHQVFRGEREIPLTPKEFALLQHLVLHQGTVVTRSEIVANVWGVNLDIYSDVLKVMISRLRKKVEAEGEAPLIHTVRGVGYILKEPADGAVAAD